MTSSRTDPDGRPLHLESVSGGGRGPALLVAAVALLLVAALLKPWGDGGVPTTAVRASPASPTSLPGGSTPKPAASRQPVADEGLLICLREDVWRLLTISERGRGMLRTWTAISPTRASKPTDGHIPWVRITERDVLNVGYCAPRRLLSGDPAGVRVSVWSRSGPTSTAAVRLTGLKPAFPSSSASRGLFGVPSSLDPGPGGPRRWPPGFYVFEIRGSVASGVDVWFGVEIAGTVATRPSPASGRTPGRG